MRPYVSAPVALQRPPRRRRPLVARSRVRHLRPVRGRAPRPTPLGARARPGGEAGPRRRRRYGSKAAGPHAAGDARRPGVRQFGRGPRPRRSRWTPRAESRETRQGPRRRPGAEEGRQDRAGDRRARRGRRARRLGRRRRARGGISGNNRLKFALRRAVVPLRRAAARARRDDAGPGLPAPRVSCF